MDNLRHGPLVFWAAATFALAVAVPVLLGLSHPRDADSGVGASAAAGPSEQRLELLELRTHLALLVSLSRDPGLELAEESEAVSARARAAAGRSGGRLAEGYLEIAGELDGLSAYIRENLDMSEGGDEGGGDAGGSGAAGDDAGSPSEEGPGSGQVSLSQLDALPEMPPGGVAAQDGPGPSLGGGAGLEGRAVRAEVARRLTRVLAVADRLVPLA